MRAGLPARPGRGGAGRDLPAEARRRRQQGRHQRPPAEGAGDGNGKRIALIGAGPASLTVARDLAPLGYDIVLYDSEPRGGGMIRSQIPRFRLPESVIDEEVGYIVGIGGIETRFGQRVDSLAGDPRAKATTRSSSAPARRAAATSTSPAGRKPRPTSISASTGSSSVSFGHIDKIGRRVIVLGGGNTAMDCCRTSRRLGGEDVKVIVRSGFEEMKASPWEKEDAMHEGIPILNYLVPKEFTHADGRLTGVIFEKVAARLRRQGPPPARADRRAGRAFRMRRRAGRRSARRTPSRGSSATSASSSTSGACRWSIPMTFQSTIPTVFFGGDSAFGPKNIIWAVAHGHEAAISIDQLLQAADVARPAAAAS